MKKILLFSVFPALFATFVSYAFDFSFPYSVVFMGIISGAIIGALATRYLYECCTLSTIILLISNFIIVNHRYGQEQINKTLNDFDNIFFIAMIIVILVVFLSAYIISYIRNYYSQTKISDE